MSNDCIPRLPAGASHEDRNAVHSCEAQFSWMVAAGGPQLDVGVASGTGPRGDMG